MRDTLLGYLRQKNPIIHHRPKKSGKSSSRCKTYTIPQKIERWKGFDPDIVHNMYSDILCRIRERAPVELESIDLRIRKEREMHNIVAGWNKKVVFKALEETGQYMGRNDLLVMVPGEKAIDPPGPKRNYEPDWAAITLDSYKDTVGDLTNNFLPGDTKCSKNWKSTEVKEGECERILDPKAPFPSWFWPVAQIYTYCFRLERRYAYIITDEELVLFRVGPNRVCPERIPSHSGPPPELDIGMLELEGKIEFVSFPWTNGRNEDGEELEELNGPSINTALWWIHLQAANDNSIKWAYPPLEDDGLPYTLLEDGTSCPRNDSCRSSENDDRTEREPSVENGGQKEDQALSSFHVRQEPSFTMPESSASRIDIGPKRRKTNRTQTAASSSNALNASFSSRSSATSVQSRLAKRKSGRRLSAARPNARNKSGGNGRS